MKTILAEFKLELKLIFGTRIAWLLIGIYSASGQPEAVADALKAFAGF